MPNALYDYLNYREYLKDYYLARKEKDPSFSHRAMSSEMGFTSPNFLKLVMDGQRSLSPSSLGKVLRGLPLKKKEREYFSLLVSFAKAKSSEEKNRIFTDLSKFRKKSGNAELTADQFEYYSHWYNPVVRELVAGRPVDLSYAQLAKEVFPSILPKQAKKSVALLLRLGLLKVKESRYALASQTISTPKDVHSLSVRNFHRQMCDIAKESLDGIPPHQRDFSSVTACISPGGLQKLKKRVADFREELMEIVRKDEDARDVYQLNFQIFPLSKPERKGDDAAD